MSYDSRSAQTVHYAEAVNDGQNQLPCYSESCSCGSCGQGQSSRRRLRREDEKVTMETGDKYAPGVPERTNHDRDEVIALWITY